MGDFVFEKTNSQISRYSTNILSSVILFGWLLIGIIGGAKIIEDFGFFSYPLAVAITSSVVLSYILIAGFKAVIITDIFQSIIIFLLLILITFSITSSESISSLTQVQTGSIDIGIVIGFFLFGILSVFSYSDRYQLCYAAKDKKRLTNGLSFAVIPILFSALLLLLIGLFMASNSPGLDSSLVFIEALKEFLPSSLLPLAIVLFFAGIMSSADTSVYAISSHYALSKKQKSIKTVRKTTLVLMTFITILALIFSNIVDVSIVAGAISLTLSFPMIYILFKGRNPRKFMYSIITSLFGFVLGLATFSISPKLALPIIIFGALGLLLGNE